MQNKKTLLTSPTLPPLENLIETNPGRRFFVSYATQQTHEQLASLRYSLSEPDQFLSPRKFAASITRDQIPAEEIPFLLKILIWGHATQTGLRQELSLPGPHYMQFEKVADADGSDIFWRRAFKHAQKSNCVLMHHGALIMGLVKKLQPSAQDTLIILDAPRLEDSITYALRKRVTPFMLQSYFGEKGTIIAGLLGIVYETLKRNYGALPGDSILIDETARSLPAWIRATQAVDNLAESPHKNRLRTVLEKENEYITFVSSFNEEVSLIKSPVGLAGHLKNCFAPFSRIIISGPALNVEFMRTFYGLDDSWVSIEEKTDVATTTAMQIPPRFPQPNAVGYFKKCTELFTELIQKHKGRCLFVASSKKAADAFYNALLPVCSQEKVALLAIGNSGGAAKASALFREHPENSILIATNAALPRIIELIPYVRVVVFQKIPFDHVADPVYKMRGNKFTDAFSQYTLPKAIMKFQELLLNFGQDKECFLLDSRLLNKDYGTKFLPF